MQSPFGRLHCAQWASEGCFVLQHSKSERSWHTFRQPVRSTRLTVCPTSCYLLLHENIYKPECYFLSSVFSSVCGPMSTLKHAWTNDANRSVIPNVAAYWLALLIRLRQAMGSVLSPDAGYAASGYWWLSSVPSRKFRNSTSWQTTTVSFPIHHWYIIRRYTTCAIEKESINNPGINQIKKLRKDENSCIYTD